jgi:hypothetical protein
MKVEPMKPVLKVPGTVHLELRSDGPLSIFAFNFNLRRCTKANAKLTGASTPDRRRWRRTRRRWRWARRRGMTGVHGDGIGFISIP